MNFKSFQYSISLITIYYLLIRGFIKSSCFLFWAKSENTVRKVWEEGLFIYSRGWSPFMFEKSKTDTNVMVTYPISPYTLLMSAISSLPPNGCQVMVGHACCLRLGRDDILPRLLEARADTSSVCCIAFSEVGSKSCHVVSSYMYM